MVDRPPCKGRNMKWSVLRKVGAALYWAEGTRPRKGKDYEVCLTNTDPEMMRIFMKYLVLFKIKM